VLVTAVGDAVDGNIAQESGRPRRSPSRSRLEPSSSAGPLVATDLHPGARRRGRHEVEPSGRAVGGEDALTTAEDDRLDHEVELVDEVGLDERAHQPRAAHDVDVPPRLLPELCHRLDYVVAGDER